MDDWHKEISEIYDEGFPATDELYAERQRKIHLITIRAIYAETANKPPFESLDAAEDSMYDYGHDYAHIWLEANEMRLTDPYIRYYVTVSVYSEAPYGSITKKTLTDLLRIRPDDYLKDLDPATSDPLTVYRGGGELTARAANCALSWTIDPLEAIFFYNRRFDDAQLWKAQIYKKDVIAYYNGRHESEIIQYRKLKNIEPLKLDAGTIAAAMDARKERLKKENPNTNYA